MEGLDLVVSEEAAGKDLLDQITAGLGQTLPPGAPVFEPRPLTMVLKAERDGVIHGALTGQSVWEWLYVHLLWVDQARQGEGLGRRLMQAAEIEAEKRGCTGLWVSTYSFQAPGFYEKMGYMPFGRIDDFPNGHVRHFYQKRFAQVAPKV
jgi:GNAT superfamily N-acetyltransferase